MRLGCYGQGAYEPRDSLYAEMTWYGHYNPMRAIRTERCKYIRNFGVRPLVYVPGDILQGEAGREMREECYGAYRPAEELYDLATDPRERETPSFADTLRETADPLLAGDVPPTPEQAVREADRSVANW